MGYPRQKAGRCRRNIREVFWGPRFALEAGVYPRQGRGTAKAPQGCCRRAQTERGTRSRERRLDREYEKANPRSEFAHSRRLRHFWVVRSVISYFWQPYRAVLFFRESIKVTNAQLWPNKTNVSRTRQAKLPYACCVVRRLGTWGHTCNAYLQGYYPTMCTLPGFALLASFTGSFPG